MATIRILSPQEVQSLSPEQRRAYLQAIGQKVIEENREAIATLASYDRGEAGAYREPHAG